MSATYHLRYNFELGSGPLWASNDASRSRFVSWVDPEALPLSPETKKEIERLSRWYDQSYNQEYPPDPGPWRQPECDRFNEASLKLYSRIIGELASDYTVSNEQPIQHEDPDLDTYLKNPKAFQRTDD